ncbi:hypothetical protein [Dethiobacter alkaliphilus]|uniref:Uncharacterized protein n=1 Tax=Dethiobacter alkaliphilus AHT 1 TaxID=555088 RepID=C0GK16_DETAL|nr:hypothetical protein [Dethiobacter alkaliphilus]EEG76286.1 conserved hypothetical protein [Dethiobacter alkaliphilus AHT 1]
MLKKGLLVSLVVLLAGVLLIGCGETEGTPDAEPGSLEGRYVGYSWRGEAGGTTLEEADRYIETILELDEDGIIQDAKMRFFVQVDGYWTTRQSGQAYVDVDFSVDPTPAVPGEDYEQGDSMFTVYTVDMMSLYTAAVDSDGTVAAAIVDPVLRYMHEMKFPADFDFDRTVGELTIGSGLAVPTTRTSGSGLIRPDNWDDLADNTLFDVSPWSHVLTDEGTMAGISDSSTVQELLEALGVEFVDGVPQEMDAVYGRYGLGGWDGNFNAIAEYLIGQDATEYTSLIDWSVERYSANIDEDNQFGLDTESGATRTVQDSIDGISGATVRLSRESTSYQRALVEAGIISEADVIIGRF